MKVSAIIPAYNEETTIGNVVRLLKNIKDIDEVIVVSDGSVDQTALIANSFGARVIELEKNIGKGGAMKTGLDICNGDVVLFLDADLIGLKEEHIKNILCPVIKDEVGMAVGIFEGGRFSTDLAQRISPFLSGQRAVKRSIIKNIYDTNCDIENSRFGIEATITGYIKENNLPYKTVMLESVTHIMKEEKMGFKEGVRARLGMYKDIVRCIVKH